MFNKLQRAAHRPHGTPARIAFIAVFFLLLQSFMSNPANAAVGQVSFSWLANPADDYVVGYRLYYGRSSKSYGYYIDFVDEKRCVADGTDSRCEPLNSSDISCVNLQGDNPRCTLFKMQDQTYVALTAYNAQEESNFTPELFIAKKGTTSTSILHLIQPLLLKGAS